MAGTATDVVTLDEIKAELRIDAAVSDHDTLLTGHIEAAVSFVSRHVDAPMVDVDETIYVPRPGGASLPVSFVALAVKSVESVKYWTFANSTLRDEPDATIAGGALGRLVSHGRHNLLYPPADGWPEALQGSLLAVQVKRGLAIDATTKALKQAVILCVRQFYDGYREIRPTEAFYALIAPWRRYD